MSGFSEQDAGQYVVVSNPVADPSQMSGRVALFNADGTPFKGGGGGMHRARYTANTISVVTASNMTMLNWVPRDDSWNDLYLDLSNPARPMPIADGVYNVGAKLYMAAAPGKHLAARMTLDANGEFVQAVQMVSLDTAVGGVTPSLTLSMTYFVPAGSPIQIEAGHDIAAPGAQIHADISVVRLS